MALQGPAYVKGVLLPEAFIQLIEIAAMSPRKLQGLGRIYANREQADDNVDNFLEGFIVVGVGQSGVTTGDNLYGEILQQTRFKDMVVVEDVDLLPKNSTQYDRYVLGKPAGFAAPTSSNT